MSVWDWLYRLGPGWPSQRGWYALALCVQTCVILVMIAMFPLLSRDEFFKSLATAIVITGWVGFAVAGRDNRADLERLGQAQSIAAGLVDHMRSAGSGGSAPAMPSPTTTGEPS
jgi:hypothetical protein